jgi:hypothetical protein
MRWDRKIRARLAKIVWEKSQEIDREIRGRVVGLNNYVRERDLRLPGYFEEIGFELAVAEEWSVDLASNHPSLFRPKGKYLYFIIPTQHILKVKKDLAAKLLVLGLP